MRLALLALIAAIAQLGIATRAENRTLTVMSYNIHAGADASVDSLAKVINDVNPDFVTLQEVDAYTSRRNASQHNGQNTIARLAAATNMFPVYARTLNFLGGYYGIAMLSKHPVEQSQVVHLPNLYNVEPRVLLEGRFLVDGQTPVVVAGTHLSVESEPTRLQQAQFIASRYANPDCAVILGGDFNSLPESDVVSTLSQCLNNLSDVKPTFPSTNPKVKLDYIFGSSQVQPVSSSVITTDGNPCSDHCPVVATISIPMQPQTAAVERILYDVRDLCLIYQGGSHRIDWTEKDFLPYVSHKFSDGSRDWTFDGFLFLELRDDEKQMRYEPFCNQQLGYRDSRKEDWEFYLDRLFEPGKSLDALDKTISKLKQEIGDPGFKHKIVLTVLPPCRGLQEWGELDGRMLSFSDEKFSAGDYGDAITACSWFIDKILERYYSHNYENLELVGMYWLAEDMNACYDLPKYIAPIVKSKGLNFIWIPYFQAPGYDNWKEYGFDKVYHQPNHFFNDAIADSQIDQAIDLARTHGLDMEFEFDSSALNTREGSKHNRMQAYIDHFTERGVFSSTPVAYYTGSYGLIDLDNSVDPADHAITDQLFRIIAARRAGKPITTEYLK